MASLSTAFLKYLSYDTMKNKTKQIYVLWDTYKWRHWHHSLLTGLLLGKGWKHFLNGVVLAMAGWIIDTVHSDFPITAEILGCKCTTDQFLSRLASDPAPLKLMGVFASGSGSNPPLLNSALEVFIAPDSSALKHLSVLKTFQQAASQLSRISFLIKQQSHSLLFYYQLASVGSLITQT